MRDIMSKEKLAEVVRERRKALGLTQTEVAERGAFSVELMRTVENNRSGRLRTSNARGLERALEWESGSIDAILAGVTY
jgi:transcriptional regulator with XRE-family HTH domain